MKIPPLTKANTKKTILLLSDDLRLHSGIGTMSREFVIQTASEFNWFQLGAAIKHPDQGKIIDVSADVNLEAGITDADVKVMPWSGYGDPVILRKLLAEIKPAAILHFTDPRFWQWLYDMEHEIRQICPIIYYAIWDDLPYPHYNALSYASCDMIMGISKQSDNIHKRVLEGFNAYVVDLDKGETPSYESDKQPVLTSYVPHGINSKYFFPIDLEKGHEDYEEYESFKEKLGIGSKYKFVVFWNNRNIRRKQPGDLLLAFKTFCDTLTEEQRKETVLLLHTQPRDENGTDLIALRETLLPVDKYNVLFSDKKLSTRELNFLYNIASVTVNIASNEGFGLSGAESIMAGTPIINNVTGGLQDQCRFEDEGGNWITFNEDFATNHTGKFVKHGAWCTPVFPTNRSLQGSLPTPYIFDDRCSYEDVAKMLTYWYLLSEDLRREAGLKGREWALSQESGLSAKVMGERFIKNINYLLKVWEPVPKFILVKASASKKELKLLGIEKNYNEERINVCTCPH